MFWVTKNLATSSMSEFEYRKPKDVVVVDVRELIDGEGNDEAVFKKLVDRADKYIKSGKRVCICCAGGQSNAVALGVLIKQGMSFEEAYNLVKKNPVAMIDPALMDLVWKIYVR